MPIRHSDDEIGVIMEMEASGDDGASWFTILILKGLAALGSLGSFGFCIPQLAAEGAGFASPEDAVSAALRVLICAIIGIILGLLALFS